MLANVMNNTVLQHLKNGYINFLYVALANIICMYVCYINGMRLMLVYVSRDNDVFTCNYIHNSHPLLLTYSLHVHLEC